MRTYTREQIQTAFQQAPDAIRAAFLSQETAEIIYSLKNQYKLHVDTAGDLGAQVGYLLLGIITPAELFGNLVLAGTDEKTARAAMEEINNRIFLPLREKMRGQASTIPAITTPSYTAAPAPLFQQPEIRPVINEPMPPAAPVAPAPAPLSQVSSADTISSEPQIRTMAHDMEDAKNHTGAQNPIPSAWSNPTTPLAPIKDAFHIEPAAPKPEPVVQQPPIEKTYGVDPYREPVQ